MLAQEELTDRVRAAAEADPGVVGLLRYGSFVHGEGDTHSDIEFYLYVHDGFDIDRFLDGMAAPTLLRHRNQFGVLAVVFEQDLVRGEIHVEPPSSIEDGRGWSAGLSGASVADVVLLDRTGRLRAAVETVVGPDPDRSDAKTMAWLAGEALIWLLMADDLLRRGEIARAHNFLVSLAHPEMLRLARARHGSTGNWLTPSRRLEGDLPSEVVERYRACVPDLASRAVDRAIGETWDWLRQLGGEHLPSPLASRLDRRLRRPPAET